MSLGGKGGISEGTPDLEGLKVSGETADILAKKAGVSKTNMYYLLAVYRNRPDLFEKVFNGEYSINKALVIRLFYEEDRKKAGIGKSSRA